MVESERTFRKDKRMKNIKRYYNEKNGIEKDIDLNINLIFFAIAFLLGVILSEYLPIAYIVGFIMIFLPVQLLRQYQKIVEYNNIK